MAQMFDGGNFDEFDESKLHRQNFPYRAYIAIDNALRGKGLATRDYRTVYWESLRSLKFDEFSLSGF